MRSGVHVMSSKNAATDRGAQTADNPRISDSLDTLLRAGDELESGRDLPGILRQIVSVTVHGVSADGGSILILDEGGCPATGLPYTVTRRNLPPILVTSPSASMAW